jgi:AP-1 complex subunit mu
MASAVFFLDMKGKPLLYRNYRGDVPVSAVEKFPMLLMEAEEESGVIPPCFSHEGINVSEMRLNSRVQSPLQKRSRNFRDSVCFAHSAYL